MANRDNIHEKNEEEQNKNERNVNERSKKIEMITASSF